MHTYIYFVWKEVTWLQTRTHFQPRLRWNIYPAVGNRTFTRESNDRMVGVSVPERITIDQINWQGTISTLALVRSFSQTEYCCCYCFFIIETFSQKQNTTFAPINLTGLIRKSATSDCFQPHRANDGWMQWLSFEFFLVVFPPILKMASKMQCTVSLG